MSYGFDIDNIDAPKYVSRGEWDITGNYAIEAFTPLKSAGAMTSGAFGVSGTYNVNNWAVPYDDISGCSGCIGVTLRRIEAYTNTGLRNSNLYRRKMGVLHEGYCFMRFQEGQLDGTIITLRYGDSIAPCTSGFRAYEIVTVEDGAIGTGLQQCKLGWYADLASDATGTIKKVKIMPNTIYGVHP